MKKSWLTALLAAFAFASVSAPALADNDWDDDDDDRPRKTRVVKKAQKQNKISMERAKIIAKSKFKGARITDADLEQRNGRPHYQVDLKDRHHDYEVWIDANTGKITHSHKERDND